MSTMVPEALLPQPSQRRGQNPMLPLTTAQTDSLYTAENEMLRAEIAKKYADILVQLGFTDETGGFIPGSVSVKAGRQQREYEYGSDQATKSVTEEAMRGGTLRSGRRSTETAKAQHPFQQAIANLMTDTPLELAGLNRDAASLIDQYVLQNNILLSQAAARAAELAAKTGGGAAGAPPAGDKGGGEGGGGGGYVDPGYDMGAAGGAPPPNYPNLNPEAPEQIYTQQPGPQGGFAYEPKPMEGNFLPQLLDTINNAIGATAPKKPKPTVNKTGGYMQTNAGDYGKKPIY